MTAVSSLHGARIQRVDAPKPALFTITLSSPGYKGTLIVSLDPSHPGVGLVPERPKGAAANSFVQKLRKELDGARVVALRRVSPSCYELRSARADGDKQLRFALGAGAPNVLLQDAEQRVLASLRPAPKTSSLEPVAEQGAGPWGESLEALEQQGAALLAGLYTTGVEHARATLLQSLSGARKRAQRRLTAVAADAARADAAPQLRADAALLLANLHAIPRGTRSARLQDFTRDPPAFVEIALDPALSPKAQAEAWFHRARRFERGAKLAAERADKTRLELEQLDALLAAARAATEPEAIATLQERARRLGARDNRVAADAGKKKTQPTRVPYRELRGFQDRPILVGKGAADNDELTLKHARPHDLWLHARDVAGAHVVVPLSRSETCPPELLLDAAHLAAHFSSHRGEPIVDITHAPRRHLRKPKGAPPGSVQLTQEKVLQLRVDPTRLKHLLATELP